MAVRQGGRTYHASMRERPPHYTFVAILLHWCLALLLIGQILLGFAMDRAGLPDTAAFSVFQIHRALGVVILMLVALRVIWRLGHKPPPHLLGTSIWQARLADAVHGALYGLQLLAPVSGWALVSCATLELPLSIFGWFDWPLLPLAHTDRNEAVLRNVHHAIVWGFAALILLHGLAALYHLIRRDGVVRRILCFRSDL